MDEIVKLRKQALAMVIWWFLAVLAVVSFGSNKIDTNSTSSTSLIVVFMKHKCGLRTLGSTSHHCRCLLNGGAMTISCTSANLKKVPDFDLGSRPVRTMTLENNAIDSIENGAFFGLKIDRLVLRNNSLSDLKYLSFWGLEYHLRNLDLSINFLGRVPVDGLRLLKNLKSLSLAENNVTSLNNNDFAILKQLRELTLDSNPIFTIESLAFVGTKLSSVSLSNGLFTKKLIPTQHLRDLKGLSLARNYLKAMPPGWSRNLSSLSYLNLEGNKLRQLDAGSFVNLEYPLRTLILARNKLKDLPSSAFARLTYLEALDMKHNKIKSLEAYAFNMSKYLEILDLSHNLITDIHAQAFAGLDKIQRVDLTHNLLIGLSEDIFMQWNSNNSTSTKFYLAGNPWLCNCHLKWLRQTLKRRAQVARVLGDASSLRCDRPYFVRDYTIARLKSHDFTCDHHYYYYYNGEDNADDDDGIDDDFVNIRDT